MFRDIFVIHCRGRKKDLEHTIWQPFGGVVSFLGSTPPPKKMPGINTGYQMRWIALQRGVLRHRAAQRNAVCAMPVIENFNYLTGSAHL